MRQRIYSLASRTSIYHHGQCPYARRMKKKNRRQGNPKKLELAGYRPCCYCNSARFHLKRSLSELEEYCRVRGMSFQRVDDSVYVATSVGFWKMQYLTQKEKFMIFHGNCPNENYDFTRLINENYHKQRDNLYEEDLLAAFVYIHKHDQFRRREKAAGGFLQDFQIDRKYRDSYAYAQKKKARQRLDALFLQIEQEHEGFIRYSFC